MERTARTLRGRDRRDEDRDKKTKHRRGRENQTIPTLVNAKHLSFCPQPNVFL